MACQIDVDIDEPATFHRAEVRTARYQYNCCECNDPIKPGTKYEHSFNRWTDVTEAFKTCLLCVEIRDNLFCNFLYTGIWESLAEENVFTLSLAGLSVAAIDKLEAFWKEYSS